MSLLVEPVDGVDGVDRMGRVGGVTNRPGSLNIPRKASTLSTSSTIPSSTSACFISLSEM
jgi:hypothetical protein